MLIHAGANAVCHLCFSANTVLCFVNDRPPRGANQNCSRPGYVLGPFLRRIVGTTHTSLCAPGARVVHKGFARSPHLLRRNKMNAAPFLALLSNYFPLVWPFSAGVEKPFDLKLWSTSHFWIRSKVIYASHSRHHLIPKILFYLSAHNIVETIMQSFFLWNLHMDLY